MACCVLLIAGVANGQNIADQRNQWIKQSSFVFSGTVTGMEASSVKGITPAQNTVTIEADSVYLKPDAITLPDSRVITVLARSPESYEEGLDVTVYSNIKQVGNQEMAVTEVGHERTKDTPDFKNLKRERDNLLLRDHIRNADIVVVGQVKNVRSVESGGKRSEHDPQWRDAVIGLDDIYKGMKDGKQIVARFPASRDVSWYDVPKLDQGQSAVLILRRAEQRTVKVDREEVPLYTIQNHMDVWSSREAERIQALMK